MGTLKGVSENGCRRRAGCIQNRESNGPTMLAAARRREHGARIAGAGTAAPFGPRTGAGAVGDTEAVVQQSRPNQPGRGGLSSGCRDGSWSYCALLTRPITLPAGSANWAITTAPGISVGGMIVVPPSCSA